MTSLFSPVGAVVFFMVWPLVQVCLVWALPIRRLHCEGSPPGGGKFPSWCPLRGRLLRRDRTRLWLVWTAGKVVCGVLGCSLVFLAWRFAVRRRCCVVVWCRNFCRVLRLRCTPMTGGYCVFVLVSVELFCRWPMWDVASVCCVAFFGR